MSAKKKQDEQTISDELIKSNAANIAADVYSNSVKSVLEHFGENSVEYAEASAEQSRPLKPQIFASAEAVEYLISELSKGAE